MKNIQQTPRGMRQTIVLCGNTNAGKSSLINAITGQEISIVSPIAGTTTDIVAKAYELLPFGPVTFIDTAGIDDDSSLGKQRVEATQKALRKADVVLWVIGETGLNDKDKQFFEELKQSQTPLLVVFNKTDISPVKDADKQFFADNNRTYVCVSASAKTGIDELKEKLVEILSLQAKEETLLGGLVEEGEKVILVAPIDSSAPKNRLILPQVQVLRELLDKHCIATVVQPQELKASILAQKETPKLIITDSQAIKEVEKIVPENIPLTTFSILFARSKGDINILIQGAKKIDELQDGDKILIAEACSHHAQDDDIAKVKIPNLISKYTSKNLKFEFCSGCDFPSDLEDYAMVIHCGGCMITRKDMNSRLNECIKRGVAVTNYGIAISKATRVLDRVIMPLRVE